MFTLLDNSVFRSLAWRLGRILYSYARRDLSKEPSKNGEYWLLEQMIRISPSSKSIFIDIGAYRGDWSNRLQDLMSHAGLSGHVYAFEPSADSFEFLKKKFNSNDNIHIEKIALSHKAGIENFYIYGETCGINSLCVFGDSVGIEQTCTQRLEDFLVERHINDVVLVKSDAEGNDFNIMCGASNFFQNGLIEVWQFEYNHRWIMAKKQLKDVFDFIANKNYRLGKLYSNGIEVYEHWHPELERFFEANYVLIRRGSEFERLCTFVRFNRNNVLV